MAQVTLRFEDREVRKWLVRMGKKRKVWIRRGINDTAKQGRSHLDTYIRTKRLNIKKKDLKPRLGLLKANTRNLTALIIGRGKGVPLEQIKGTRALKGRGRGKRRTRTRVEVTPGKQKILKSGFRLTDGRVFGRTGRGRYPIRRLYTTSIPSIMRSRRTVKTFRRHVRRVGPKLIRRQIALGIEKL